MAPLDDFMPHVLPYVHACSFPMAALHIREICRDFCTFAPIAQETSDPMDAIEQQREYDIDVPSGAECTVILKAWYEGRELVPLKTGDRNESGYGQGAGSPTGFKQLLGNRFMLDVAPAHTSPRALTLLIATRPTHRADYVADVLAQDYAYAIGQGVVGRLKKIPGMPFSDIAAAGLYTSAYLVARTDARIRAENSFGNAQSRVRPRRFE